MGKLFNDAADFVEQVCLADLMAIAPFYTDWAGIGGGLKNYMAYGDLPTNGCADVSSFKFPRGVILDRDLGVTGFLIGRPIAFQSSVEPSFGYWFGTVRFIHFSVAYLLIFNFLFRIYWGFVGNKYATWPNFIPLRPSQWKEILRVLRVDIMLGEVEKPIESSGHNALAGLIYFLSFLVSSPRWPRGSLCIQP